MKVRLKEEAHARFHEVTGRNYSDDHSYEFIAQNGKYTIDVVHAQGFVTLPLSKEDYRELKAFSIPTGIRKSQAPKTQTVNT